LKLFAFRSRRAPLALAGLLLALAPLAAQAQVRIDRTWLSYDSAASRLTFTLVAGLGGANGGMNFNGAVRGGIVLTVPVGWRVTVKFRNADQMQPHSAIVIPMTPQVPATAGRPAFAGAATRQVVSGTNPDGHEDLVFTADHAGEYIIFCGVPGHGMAGMWIRMVVSAEATHPTISLSTRPAG
jgi:sulfocyanin